MKQKIKKYFDILSKFLGFIVLILLIVSIYKFLNIGSLFSSEITNYPVLCKEKPILNQCDNPEYTLGKTTYKILSNRQEVLYWHELYKKTERLTKCAIKDKKNWSCKYDDESMEFGFTYGKYWEISSKSSSIDDFWGDVYYSSRTEYLMVQCENNILCFFFVNLLD